jgi:hypothetical protein
MSQIDLRRYVTSDLKSLNRHGGGTGLSATLLRLTKFGQEVTLSGPLSVRVTVQVLNQFTLAKSQSEEQLRPLYSYRLDIPAGREWTYVYPRSVESAAVALGSNAAFEVHIEPAGGATDYYDALGVDPYRAESGCGCHATPCSCQPAARGDLPCDFAVGNNRHIGQFFPSACEPCAPNAFLRMPPLQGPRLNVAPAAGGSTRTNYFNGMCITKEDLLTDQRNMRIKQQLQNRALGQGVVWGFGVRQDGGQISVSPGYGVDCCGNDIAITSVYQVDQQLLVQDPAAAAELAQRGPRRMHLLLEYYECPEDPRPVHGDICSPETTHCEMGRIRETARLRLVPPRDLDTSGPIAEFIKRLTAKKDRSTVKETAASLTPTLVSAPNGTPTPFFIEARVVSGFDSSIAEVPPIVLTPQYGTTKNISMLPFVVSSQGPMEVQVSLKIPYESKQQLLSAQVKMVQGPPAEYTDVFSVNGMRMHATASDTSVWSVVFKDARTPMRFDGTLIFEVVNWTVSNNDQPQTVTAEGTTTLTISWSRTSANSSIQLHLSAFTRGEVAAAATRFRCLTEACDPDGGPLFPVNPPWLHGIAGAKESFDWSALRLAVEYASALSNSRPKVPDNAANRRVFDEIAKLFQDWCQAGLYRGPRCSGEPHGVVIGCAVVEGGRIVSVDPWGGRRWVLHFPLLTHWTGLAGVAPLDYLASKLFEFLCCVGSHPYEGLLARDGRERSTEFTGVGMPLGTSWLFFQSRQEVKAALPKLDLTDRVLSLGEFLSRATALVSTPSTQPLESGADVLSTAALPEIFLVVPAHPDESGNSPREKATTLDPLRLPGLVRGAIAALPQERSVPRLLQSFAVNLATRLLTAVPLDSLGDRDPQVLEPLAKAGYGDVASLLAADPDRLHSEVLNSKAAKPLAKLLEASEQIAREVVATVGQVVHEANREGLNVREDLADSKTFDRFVLILLGRLGNSDPSKVLTLAVVRQAVAEAAGRTL